LPVGSLRVVVVSRERLLPVLALPLTGLPLFVVALVDHSPLVLPLSRGCNTHSLEIIYPLCLLQSNKTISSTVGYKLGFVDF
jgi:hypothetical protein